MTIRKKNVNQRVIICIKKELCCLSIKICLLHYSTKPVDLSTPNIYSWGHRVMIVLGTFLCSICGLWLLNVTHVMEHHDYDNLKENDTLRSPQTLLYLWQNSNVTNSDSSHVIKSIWHYILYKKHTWFPNFVSYTWPFYKKK